MTLEELDEMVEGVFALSVPKGVTASFSIHQIDEALLMEYVDSLDPSWVTKTTTGDGAKVARLGAEAGHVVALFGKAPERSAW